MLLYFYDKDKLNLFTILIQLDYAESDKPVI